MVVEKEYGMANSFEALLSQFDPTLPFERARTIPASWYTEAIDL